MAFQPETKPQPAWGRRLRVEPEFEASEFEAADFQVGGVRTFDTPIEPPLAAWGTTSHPYSNWTKTTKPTPAWG